MGIVSIEMNWDVVLITNVADQCSVHNVKKGTKYGSLRNTVSKRFRSG
jgi:hypothetical protein